MVNEFMVRNYRNVSVGKIELGRVNLLIGPNGSGKSNFLKSLSFWASIVKNKNRTTEGTTSLYETFAQSGWDRMLNFEADERFIDFSWVFSPDDLSNPCMYKLKLRMGDTMADRRGFYIASEALSYARPLDKQQHDTPYNFYSCHGETPGSGYFTDGKSDKPRKKLTVRDNETAFLQLDELRVADEEFDNNYRSVYADRITGLLKYLSRFFCYSSSDFVLSTIKKPTTNNQYSQLLPDASNLVGVVHHWQLTEDDTLYRFSRMVAPLFGETAPVTIAAEPMPQTNDLRLIVRIRSKKYLLDDLSDGTIRAMILAALLVDRKDTMSVCAIDEPEMNLHPEWQSRFTDWLMASSASKQFFISSHSPEILDPLTPAFMDGIIKVFVFSETQPITELTPNRVDNLYNKGFNLGDLYRAKAIEIGGWPK